MAHSGTICRAPVVRHLGAFTVVSSYIVYACLLPLSSLGWRRLRVECASLQASLGLVESASAYPPSWDLVPILSTFSRESPMPTGSTSRRMKMRSPWGDTASIGAIFKVGNGASVASVSVAGLRCLLQLSASVTCLTTSVACYNCSLQFPSRDSGDSMFLCVPTGVLWHANCHYQPRRELCPPVRKRTELSRAAP